jgi:hypothetical protein
MAKYSIQNTAKYLLQTSPHSTLNDRITNHPFQAGHDDAGSPSEFMPHELRRHDEMIEAIRLANQESDIGNFYRNRFKRESSPRGMIPEPSGAPAVVVDHYNPVRRVVPDRYVVPDPVFKQGRRAVGP